MYNLSVLLYFIALIQTFIGSSFHWITGYLTGIKITLRDVYNDEQYRSKFSLLWVPILVRVFLVFHILACLNGIFHNYSWAEFWLVFFIPPVILFAVLCYHTRITEKKLPFEYLQRVGGFMSGYSMVPNADPTPQDSPRVQIHPSHTHSHLQSNLGGNRGGQAPSLYLGNAPQHYDVNNVTYPQFNPDGSINSTRGLSQAIIDSGVPSGVPGAGIASPTHNTASPNRDKPGATRATTPSSTSRNGRRTRQQTDEKQDDPEAKVRNFLDI